MRSGCFRKEEQIAKDHQSRLRQHTMKSTSKSHVPRGQICRCSHRVRSVGGHSGCSDHNTRRVEERQRCTWLAGASDLALGANQRCRCHRGRSERADHNGSSLHKIGNTGGIALSGSEGRGPDRQIRDADGPGAVALNGSRTCGSVGRFELDCDCGTGCPLSDNDAGTVFRSDRSDTRRLKDHRLTCRGTIRFTASAVHLSDGENCGAALAES